MRMRKVSKVRQEQAASAGIVLPLMRLIANSSPLRQLAIPLLCDLVHAGQLAHRALVVSHTKMPSFAVFDMNLAAVLTTSPYSAYSHSCLVPTYPQNASPVATPVRVWTPFAAVSEGRSVRSAVGVELKGVSRS